MVSCTSGRALPWPEPAVLGMLGMQGWMQAGCRAGCHAATLQLGSAASGMPPRCTPREATTGISGARRNGRRAGVAANHHFASRCNRPKRK